ncbi:MAG: T9SS type A sorting domain-containing protein [Bacteroidaceae bacterium]|nr:T9SS type A sorting domain-containing protein [Bacteroidaceae bacterium]
MGIKRTFLPFILLFFICFESAKADRIIFTYDASGNRIYSEKEILIRGDESQNRDKKPRLQDLSLFHITIYPNPTQGQLRVEITGAESLEGASITIYSSSGSVIYYDNALDTVNDMDLTPCPNGIYLLMIRMGGETSSWKIIKI